MCISAARSAVNNSVQLNFKTFRTKSLVRFSNKISIPLLLYFTISFSMANVMGLACCPTCPPVNAFMKTAVLGFLFSRSASNSASGNVLTNSGGGHKYLSGPFYVCNLLSVVDIEAAGRLCYHCRWVAVLLL